MQLHPVRGGEVHISKHIVLGLVHKGGKLWQAGLHLVDYLAPLDPSGGLVLLCEDGADKGGGDPAAIAPGMCEQVAHEVNPAVLPGGVQYACDGGLQPFMGVGDHQLDAAQPATGQRAKELRPERFGSEQPTAMPRTSRRPSSLTPIATLAPAEAGGDSDRDDASALPHLYISGVEPDIRPTAFQRTVQESLDLFIDLAHSRDTWLLEMPLIPMAWTSSSTERVMISAVIVGSSVWVQLWGPNLTEDPR